MEQHYPNTNFLVERAKISTRLWNELGAALDVFCKEPPESDNPLFNCPNTLLLPHIGAGSEEALEKVGKVAVQNVIDFFAGKTVKTILNPDYIKNIK